MKKLLLLVLAAMGGLGLWAQSPQSFNYQAVARNATGTPLANQSVSFRVTIHEASPTGTAVYVETHQDVTNDFGLSNLAIGQGTVVSGTFSSIGWGSNTHYLEIEFDPNGGSSYLSMGTTQMLSVPYALHASTVEFDNVDDADSDPSNEFQTLSLSGDTLSLSDGNFVLLTQGSDDQLLAISNDTLNIEDGNGVDLSVYLDNTDGQILIVSNDSLFISGGNGVDLSAFLDDTDTDDQNLSLSNDSLLIDDGTGVDLSAFLDDTDTDDQNLSLSNDSLLIDDGTGVDLSAFLDDTDTDDQNLSLSNDSLLIDDGTGVDLSAFLDDTDTDDQNLSLSNDSLLIDDGTGVDLSAFLDDTDTDDQNLSLSNDSLLIDDGTGVDLSAFLDDTDTDDQNLSLSNDSLLIDDGTGVNLAAYLDNTDGQQLSLGSNTLAITNGNSVSLSGYLDNTDSQTLSLNGDDLSISGGNTVSLSSLSEIDEIADADDDTKIQVEESSDEDMIRFDLEGAEYLRLQGGRMNLQNSGLSVIIGQNAGQNDDLSNNENIFIGYLTGRFNETSSAGIGIGRAAMENHTSGNFSIAVGNYSFQNHESGSNNVTVGAYSLNNNVDGTDNTAMGTGAMRFDTSGSNNIAIGAFCLYNGQDLDNNVAIGHYSGYNATGDGNIFIGRNSGRNSTGSDQLYIDNSNTTSPLFYGEFDNDLARINGELEVTGVLEAATTSTLGNITTNSESTDQGTSSNAGLGFAVTPWLYTNAIEAQDERGSSSTLITLGADGTYGSSDQIHMVTNGNANVSIISDGKVGIDKTAPDTDLHIRQSQQSITGGTGGIKFEESGDATDYWRIYHSGIYFSFNKSGSRVAYIEGNGTYVTTSDRKFKKNVAGMLPVLDRVKQMRPVSYHYNRQEESENKVLGFIAQEVQPLFPEIVFESEDGSLGMGYAHLGVIAIKAVQEQQEVIDSQQEVIESQQNRIDEVENQMGEMMQQMQAMQKQLQALQNASK